MSCQEVVCDANNLYKAYLASIKGSKWKESTQRYMLNYLIYIFKLKNDLENKTYRNSSTDEFTLRERGRERPITSLQVQDRIVRHLICDDIFLPEIRKRIIYDNGASIKGRGLSFARKRFETHLHKYYRYYGTNEGYILFGDFSKFYDNIIHSIAKEQLLNLVDHDEFMTWLLDVIFSGFEIDVSYMSDKEYANCMNTVFNKSAYREIPKSKLTGEKFMAKSVNIGDQLSQDVGVYYPNKIDTCVKYVRSQKYYGRYMDDFYLISPSKNELIDILKEIDNIAASLGIHLNYKKTRIVKLNRAFTYLQYRYRLTKSGHLSKRINPKRVISMRRKLKKLHKKMLTGEIEYSRIENSFRSWIGNFYKLLTRSQYNNILDLYFDLYGIRYIVRKGKLIAKEN